MNVDRIHVFQREPLPSSSKSLQLVDAVTTAFGPQIKVKFDTLQTLYDASYREMTTSTVDFYTKGRIFYRRTLRLCGEPQWSYGVDTVQEVCLEPFSVQPVLIRRKRNPIPQKFTGYISLTTLPAGVQQVLNKHEIPQREKGFYT